MLATAFAFAYICPCERAEDLRAGQGQALGQPPGRSKHRVLLGGWSPARWARCRSTMGAYKVRAT